jgi:AraC-like DNA-binding protein
LSDRDLVVRRPPEVAEYPAGARLRPRVIDDLELVWALEGSFTFRADGLPALTLTPSDLLLVPPGIRHEFVWDARRRSRHGYVHFSLAGPAPRQALPPLPLVGTGGPDDPLVQACRYLVWLPGQGGGAWEQPVRATIRYLLALLVHGPLPGAAPALPAPVTAALDDLRRTWDTLPLVPVSPQRLAAGAAVSAGYLNRLFRASFGHSTAATLERARLARAEQMLARTDLPVATVARQCGYADAAHFGHRFAAVHGTSPGRWRRAAGAPSVLADDGIRRAVAALWS